MNKGMRKNTFREIRSSLGRWIAILAIVALGVGFFCGLKMCKDDFVETGNQFVLSQNMYNCQLITTLGLEDEDVETISKVDGVLHAIGSRSVDFLVTEEGSYDGEQVAKVHTYSDQINLLDLKAGRLPEAKGEFAGDRRHFSEDDIGKTITLSDINDPDTLDTIRGTEFVLTGIVESPVYMNNERGSSSLGNGTVDFYMYVLPENWDTEIYTEIYVDFEEDYPIFTEEYEAYEELMESRLEEALELCAARRYDIVIEDAREELEEAKEQLEEAEAEINSYSYQLESGKQNIIAGQAEIDAGWEEFEEAKDQYLMIKTSYEVAMMVYDSMLETAYAEIDAALAAAELTEEQYADAKKAIDAQMEASRQEMESYRAQMEAAEAELDAAEAQLNQAQAELDAGSQQLLGAEAELNQGKEELEEAKEEFKKAEEQVNDIEFPSTYVLTRNKNIGYACFENDSKIVDGISRVFPIFFFLVAALVCMTTMTRMIDEQRTQIGVLKALGYSRNQILSKYVTYSGSAAFLGATIGFFTGIHLFPYVIWVVYGLMYGFADIVFIISWPLGLASLAVSLLCCVGTTIWACSSELKEVPAQLIRPKSPPAGKRIFLEKIPTIWERLPFLHKVSIRNTFRYKKRFFMMVLGISGCTALLITGLGVKDSIANIVSAQYDNIYHVDYTVSFQKDMGEYEQDQFLEDAGAVISDCVFLYSGSGDVEANGMTKTVNIVGAGQRDRTSRFISLYNEDGTIRWPSMGECVITANVAKAMDLSVDDIITVYDTEMQEMTVRIAAICDNYVNNYVYINDETFESQWGTMERNSAFVQGITNEEGELEYTYEDAAFMMSARNVSTVSITSDFRARIDTMMASLNYIVILVVLSAGALAFIVLYNLTNINITERIREIATIKVLGFYSGETAQYVFRENMLLTAIASLVGLPLGALLHAFVMSQVNVDGLSFDIHIDPSSYLFGIVITFLFSILVNLVMRRKLERVSMTESLKSIE